MFLQIAQNQITYSRLANIDNGTKTFKDLVSSAGCITSKDAEWLKDYIAETANCNREDVAISGTEEPKSKGELIHYVVQVRLTGLLAAKKFWGFEDSDDQKTYKLDRYVVSNKEKESEESNSDYRTNNFNGLVHGVSKGC